MKIENYNAKILEPTLRPWHSAKNKDRQIAVLMSGGVDSSVTAHLLQQQGYDVLGVTMRFGEVGNGCCGADAPVVCCRLGIAHYFVEVSEAFTELIIKPFQQSYLNGNTPNPCVDCNSHLKFSLVWDLITETFGIEHLATGHYAKITPDGKDFYLGMANYQAKDQSYFLYGIRRERLSRLSFPLGDLTKEETRQIAADMNLTVADKPESMELCFVGQGDYRQALLEEQTDQPGDITDMEGNVLAQHKGISHYTLGQRQGLGYAGGVPLYVAKIDAQANTVALGSREDISSNIIKANQINILIPQQFRTDQPCLGKIRSYGTGHICKIVEAQNDEMKVEFETPLFAPCPGQKLVLYNDQKNIIAGGTIIS